MTFNKKKPIAAGAAVLVVAGLAITPHLISAQEQEEAGLTVKFNLPENVEASFTEAAYEVIGRDPETGGRKTIATKSFEPGSFEDLVDLPNDGDYAVLVYTNGKDNLGNANKPGAYYEFKMITYADGATPEAEFTYSTFDPSAVKGDSSATGKLLDMEGNPRPNQTVSIVTEIENAGMYEVASVTSDDTGTFKATGLKQGEPYMVALGMSTVVGRIQGGSSDQAEFKIPPIAGDSVPNTGFKKLSDGSDLTLADFKGKVVVLDFWATWCGPCQPAVSKLNTYRDKHPEWGDRVELIALSTDQSDAKVKSHIEKNEWNDLYHAWIGSSPAIQQSFAVDAIPTTFIIGPDGRIIARGHPMELDIPALVDSELEKMKPAT